jgi:Dynamin family
MSLDLPYTPVAYQPALAPLALAALWRHKAGKALRAWQQWLNDESLSNAAIKEHLQQAQERLSKTQLTIAVVAEVSRGKSELINAMLFAQHGTRIVPSGAGRTTMCPTEFFCDEDIAPYLEVLPLVTREQSISFQTLCNTPSAWERIDIQGDSAEHWEAALLKVVETQFVTPELAQRWGIHEDADERTAAPEGFDTDEPSLGLVEVPKWRYARVNVHHPLLACGVSILDTPGLNVLGHEPELTYAVLPHADAVVFLLAADVGVTRSDQATWRQYLSHLPEHSKLAVLNKIDSFIDELRSPLAVQADIIQQIERAASALNLPKRQVLAISARQGLLARIRQDETLLAQSRLTQLEAALTGQLLEKRQKQLKSHTLNTLEHSHRLAAQRLESEKLLLQNQLTELAALSANRNPEQALSAYASTTEKRITLADALSKNTRQMMAIHRSTMLDYLSNQAIQNDFESVIISCQQAPVSVVKQQLQAAIMQVHSRLSQVRIEASQPLASARSALNRINPLNGIASEVGLSQAPQLHEMLSFESALLELERLSASCGEQLPSLPLLSNAQRKRMAQTVLALQLRCEQLGETAKAQSEAWLAGLNEPITQGLELQYQLLAKRSDTQARMQQAQQALALNLTALSQGLEAKNEQLRRLKDRYKQAIVLVAGEQPSP